MFRLRIAKDSVSCIRVQSQVLGFLRAAHARGAALGRLRPSGLRVTGSCIVLLDPAAQIPADEEVCRLDFPLLFGFHSCARLNDEVAADFSMKRSHGRINTGQRGRL